MNIVCVSCWLIRFLSASLIWKLHLCYGVRNLSHWVFFMFRFRIAWIFMRILLVYGKWRKQHKKILSIHHCAPLTDSSNIRLYENKRMLGFNSKFKTHLVDYNFVFVKLEPWKSKTIHDPVPVYIIIFSCTSVDVKEENIFLLFFDFCWNIFMVSFHSMCLCVTQYPFWQIKFSRLQKELKRNLLTLYPIGMCYEQQVT